MYNIIIIICFRLSLPLPTHLLYPPFYIIINSLQPEEGQSNKGLSSGIIDLLSSAHWWKPDKPTPSQTINAICYTKVYTTVHTNVHSTYIQNNASNNYLHIFIINFTQRAHYIVAGSSCGYIYILSSRNEQE